MFSNNVFYTQRGKDSSYFDFIPTFGLNWNCFGADFGLQTVASGTKLRGFWRNCIALAPL